MFFIILETTINFPIFLNLYFLNISKFEFDLFFLHLHKNFIYLYLVTMLKNFRDDPI